MLHLADVQKRSEIFPLCLHLHVCGDGANPAVDHNSSFKDTICLPQQLSLISFIRRRPLCATRTQRKACGLLILNNFVIVRMADVLTAFH